MITYYTRKTPDYSPLVVHFTKEADRKMVRDDLIDESHPLFAHKNSAAIERLKSILEFKTIYASPMPFLPNNRSAVCFSECIWDALVDLARVYSPYGIVFSKRLVFEKGGGPALYIRGDTLKLVQQNIPSDLEPLVAPFDPMGVMKPGVKLDFLHEREWRLPRPLTFEYTDVKYVVVASVPDVIQVMQHIGTQHISVDRFIPMDVYRTIVTEWRSA